MPQNENQQNKQYIIVDTCVIQASESKQKTKSEAVIKCLKDLIDTGYSLTISEFSVFENLHGLWGEKAEEAVKILKGYALKIVSREVLLLAAILGGLYYEEKYDYIQTGDKIIGATAILENGLVLTYNHRDFPPPFFLTEKSITLQYKRDHYVQHLDLAIYKPDIKLIGRRIAEKDR